MHARYTKSYDAQEQNMSSTTHRYERLPSRNVTFTSAEILTVSELCESLKQIPNERSKEDDNEDHNTKSTFKYTSARITGTILAHDYDNGFLTIGDPLVQQHLQSRSATKRPNKSSYNSTIGTKISTDVGAGVSPFAAKRLQAAQHLQHQQRSISQQPAYKRPGILGSRGPLVSKRRKPLPSSASTGIHTTNNNNNRKMTIPKVVHVDIQAAGSIRSKIGDLVMCIGELRSICTATDVPCAALKKACNDVSSRGYLQARIARNKNGLDVHLQYRALLLKREYLMTRQSAKVSACDDSSEVVETDEHEKAAARKGTDEESSTTGIVDNGGNDVDIDGKVVAMESSPPPRSESVGVSGKSDS